MNALYRTAEALEAEIAYDSEARDLAIENGRFVSASVALNGAVYEVQADTLVAAAGGFEANIPWLKQYWGDVADNFIVRGTPTTRVGCCARCSTAASGRSAIRAVPRRRGRRARAQVRRRDRHPRRLRAARHRGQSGGPALL